MEDQSGENEVPGDVGGKRPGGRSSLESRGTVGGSAGGGGGLPFTGFLAIPVLLVGAGLLLGGVGLGRRGEKVAS